MNTKEVMALVTSKDTAVKIMISFNALNSYKQNGVYLRPHEFSLALVRSFESVGISIPVLKDNTTNSVLDKLIRKSGIDLAA